jgi:hypothetical protein
MAHGNELLAGVERMNKFIAAGGFIPDDEARIPLERIRPIDENEVLVCSKCSGTGRFHSRTSTFVGKCFACDGTGRVKQKEKIAVVADKLKVIFDRELAEGKKKPTLRFQQFTAKLAPLGGKNPGAIYLSSADGVDYLGMIKAGQYAPTPQATEEQRKAIVATMADPMPLKCHSKRR